VLLQVSSDHGGATYSVSVTDSGVRGGDVLDGLRLGVKSGGLEAIYEPNNGHHLIRTNHTLSVSFGEPRSGHVMTPQNRQRECRGRRGGAFRAIGASCVGEAPPESPQLSRRGASRPPAASCKAPA
jgi:hypothetical protein